MKAGFGSKKVVCHHLPNDPGLGFKAFNSYNSHCRNLSDMEPQDLLCESGSANESGNIWNSLSQYKKIKGDEDFVFIGGSTFVVADALKCEDLLKKSPKSLQNKI